MERQTIAYKTEEEWLAARAQDLTSSEVSALFGLNKYVSVFELWHAKKSGVPIPFEEQEYTKWGNRLEKAIADGVAEEKDLIVLPFKEYVRIPSLRIGSSFDFQIVESVGTNAEDTYIEPVSLLEIKNVNQFIFKEEWVVDAETKEVIESPPHIEIQIQHQMLVSGIYKAVIAALINGNKLILLERSADAEIQAAILEKAAAFWASVDANKEPAPDFTRDARAISRIYGYAEPGKVLEAYENEPMLEMVKEYYTLGQQINKADERREEIKGRILTEIGDSEKVVHSMFSISAGTVGPAHIEYDRKGFRMFRITPKKELKESLK
jgi:predicted phage-related endonuclease